MEGSSLKNHLSHTDSVRLRLLLKIRFSQNCNNNSINYGGGGLERERRKEGREGGREGGKEGRAGRPASGAQRRPRPRLSSWVTCSLYARPLIILNQSRARGEVQPFGSTLSFI